MQLYLTKCATPSISTPMAIAPLEPTLPFGFLPRIYESIIDKDDHLHRLDCSAEGQLELDFSCSSQEMEASSCTAKARAKTIDDTNITFLAPKTFYPILNKHFPSWVIQERRLRKLADLLEDQGIIFVGQVVQCTRLELHTFLANEQYARRRKRIDRLERLLSDYDLRLNMAVPRWRAPSEDTLYPE